MYDVKIAQCPARRLAGMEHRGPYMEIGRTFDALYGVLGARHLIAPDQEIGAVYFDDPALVAAADLRAFAGVTISSDFSVAAPLTHFAIAAGENAVLRHVGPYDQLHAAYEYLFGVWLPQSGRQPSGQPNYEIYRNTPMNAAPCDLVTDIHLPLRAQDAKA